MKDEIMKLGRTNFAVKDKDDTDEEDTEDTEETVQLAPKNKVSTSIAPTIVDPVATQSLMERYKESYGSPKARREKGYEVFISEDTLPLVKKEAEAWKEYTAENPSVITQLQDENISRRNKKLYQRN